MSIEYKDGKLVVDGYSLIEYLPKDQVLEFIETLSCHDIVIKHVTDQIIERWTENNCCGSSGYPTPTEPTTGLDWAWREVAKRSDEVAKFTILKLEEALKYKDDKIKELRALNDTLSYKLERDIYER